MASDRKFSCLAPLPAAGLRRGVPAPGPLEVTASQNGWRVLQRSECVTIAVPGGELAVHPKLAVIFTDLATQWHTRVSRLLWPGCWGHAVRPIKGSQSYSNHSSGTAVDFSAPELPQGVAARILLTAGELSTVAELEARYAPVLEWGGRWSGKSVDSMHWEVAKGVTVEQVDALTARLGGVSADPPAAPPAPAPAPAATPAGWTGPDMIGTGLSLRGDEGCNGRRVALLQSFWRTRYPAYAKHLAADGWWGPQTSAACREFALRSGIRTADGRNVGPQLARKLYLAGFRG